MNQWMKGNLTQDGRWVYTWNGENQLIRMTTRSDVPGPHRQITFQYDWMGRRIRKTVVDLDTGQTVSDTVFLYDGWNLIAEVDAQTGELLRIYVWGLDLSGTMQGAGGIGGLLWITRLASPVSCFVIYDGNGNVMGLISTSDGSVVAQYEYGPFAEPLRAIGSLAADNPIRFSTKYTDSETGLVYYGYRYYSSSLGRWLSRDPIDTEAEVEKEKEIGVREDSGYRFVGNRPMDRTDFLGLLVKCPCSQEKVKELAAKISLKYIDKTNQPNGVEYGGVICCDPCKKKVCAGKVVEGTRSAIYGKTFMSITLRQSQCKKGDYLMAFWHTHPADEPWQKPNDGRPSSDWVFLKETVERGKDVCEGIVSYMKNTKVRITASYYNQGNPREAEIK